MVVAYPIPGAFAPWLLAIAPNRGGFCFCCRLPLIERALISLHPFAERKATSKTGLRSG